MLTSPLVVQAIESGVGSASAASSSSGGGSGSASMKILGQMARTSSKSSSSGGSGGVSGSHGGKVRVRAVADRIFMRLAANLKMDSARMLGYFLRKAWRRVSSKIRYVFINI